MPVRLVQTKTISSVLAVVELAVKAVARREERALVGAQAELLMKVVQPDHGSFVVDQVVIAEFAGYSVDQEAP